MEWNDLPFGETVFRQYLPDHAGDAVNYWNLILFNEHEREDGHADVADAQKSVHALRGARLPGGMSADGAIVQYTNGIVDFQQANCIGCGLLHYRSPFDIPKMNPKTNRVFKARCARIALAKG